MAARTWSLSRVLAVARSPSFPRPSVAFESMAVGDALPDMPLFLTADRYVNVPLETTYRTARRGVPKCWKRVIVGNGPRQQAKELGDRRMVALEAKQLVWVAGASRQESNPAFGKSRAAARFRVAVLGLRPRRPTGRIWRWPGRRRRPSGSPMPRETLARRAGPCRSRSGSPPAGG